MSSAMATEKVIVEPRGAVLLITLNRYGVRNAVDQASAEAVGAAIELLEHDAALQAGVIAGNGPVFRTGMGAIVAPVRQSADAHEGALALVEKRKPVWQGPNA
jgi:hypothetical protein